MIPAMTGSSLGMDPIVGHQLIIEAVRIIRHRLLMLLPSRHGLRHLHLQLQQSRFLPSSFPMTIIMIRLPSLVSLSKRSLRLHFGAERRGSVPEM